SIIPKPLLAFAAILACGLCENGYAAAPEKMQSIYDAVLARKTCHARGTEQALSCEYRVGNDLHFSIDGIGDPDTGITFLHSSFEGDYFASVGVMHGCVVVKHGKKTLPNPLDVVADFAFVSPKNGKVYRNWKQCQRAE